MQLRVHEVASLFDVGESLVHAWIRDEGLPARINNAQYRVNCGELVEWATLTRRAIPESLLEKLGSGSSTLADALEFGGVHHGLPGGAPRTVLTEAVARLPQLAAGEREELLALLLSREEGHSTAIGGGIAIPHPSRPLVLSLRRPLVALCFLSQGLDAPTPDGLPIRALFVVIAPNARSHLYLLGQVATSLGRADFHAAIERQSSAAEILALARRRTSADEPAAAAV